MTTVLITQPEKHTAHGSNSFLCKVQKSTALETIAQIYLPYLLLFASLVESESVLPTMVMIKSTESNIL